MWQQPMFAWYVRNWCMGCQTRVESGPHKVRSTWFSHSPLSNLGPVYGSITVQDKDDNRCCLPDHVSGIGCSGKRVHWVARSHRQEFFSHFPNFHVALSLNDNKNCVFRHLCVILQCSVEKFLDPAFPCKLARPGSPFQNASHNHVEAKGPSSRIVAHRLVAMPRCNKTPPSLHFYSKSPKVGQSG